MFAVSIPSGTYSQEPKLTFIRSVNLQLINWKRALALVWKAAPGYTLSWALLLLVQGLLPASAVYLTKYLIDSLVAAKSSGGAWPELQLALIYAVLMGVLLLIIEILQSVSGWVRAAQGEFVTDHLMDQLHRQASRLDLSYYESPEYYDLMERARGDSSSRPLALLESAGASMQHSISLLAMTGLLVAYVSWLPVVLVVATSPALLITMRSDRAFHRWWKRRSDDRRWAVYFDAMLTHSNSAMEMRLFGLSDHFRRSYQEIRSKLRSERLAHLSRQNHGRMAAAAAGLVVAGGALAWMGYRVIHNLGTLGDLAMFYQVFSRGQTLIGALFGAAAKTVNNGLYLESLFAFLDLQPKIASPINPRRIPDGPAKQLAFNNVTFYYPGTDKPALKDFSLVIPVGKIIALVGINGAGKSTIIKLLNRFYDPSEGNIEIDGKDLRELDLHELRRMISVLFQFPMQYQATCAENIALGDIRKAAGEAEITEAAARAGAHDFIINLSNQYETLLGKWFLNGTELSGGEWQRLALARAYFRRAPVIILDEPTSFMDSWAETDWFDRFREMATGRTGVIITHRFTIAMRADIINVMEGGQIVESGSHLQLLAMNGRYAESWRAQLSAVDAAEESDRSYLR